MGKVSESGGGAAGEVAQELKALAASPEDWAGHDCLCL